MSSGGGSSSRLRHGWCGFVEPTTLILLAIVGAGGPGGGRTLLEMPFVEPGAPAGAEHAPA